MRKRPETPTLDKMVKIHEASQVIGEFLDWMVNEAGYVICVVNDEDGTPFTPAPKNIQQILEEYFEIDLEQAERERMALLRHLQEIQGLIRCDVCGKEQWTWIPEDEGEDSPECCGKPMRLVKMNVPVDEMVKEGEARDPQA